MALPRRFPPEQGACHPLRKLPHDKRFNFKVAAFGPCLKHLRALAALWEYEKYKKYKISQRYQRYENREKSTKKVQKSTKCTKQGSSVSYEMGAGKVQVGYVI